MEGIKEAHRLALSNVDFSSLCYVLAPSQGGARDAACQRETEFGSSYVVFITNVVDQTNRRRRNCEATAAAPEACTVPPWRPSIPLKRFALC
jgi:hypothetical protein